MKHSAVSFGLVVFCFFSGSVLAHDRVDEIIQKSKERSQKSAAMLERLESRIERLKKETGADCVTLISDCAKAAEVILSDKVVVKALKKINSQNVYVLIFYATDVMPYIGEAGGVFIPSGVTLEQLKKYLGIQ